MPMQAFGRFHRVSQRALASCGRRWTGPVSNTNVSGLVSRRFFGNAPARVRPSETPREHSLRQSEREYSASVVVVFMIAFPLWLFVLTAGDKENKREEVKAWALQQRALHRPKDDQGSP